MPDAFRNWARRHTPALAALYLLVLGLISLGSLGVLFEWRGSGRVIERIERYCHLAVQSEVEEWDLRRRQAERLFAEGDVAGAERAFDSLLADIPIMSRLGPDGLARSRVLKRLVDVYLAQGSRSRAIRAAEALLLLNPDYAEETFIYGKTLIACGRDEEGERQLLKSLDLDPNYTPAVEYLIARFAESARMEEILAVHDRYKAAVSAAFGAVDPANGVIELLDGNSRVAALRYLPALAPTERAIHLALGAGEYAGSGRIVDGLRIALTLPPECGRFEILSILLLPRQHLGSETPPLAEIRDFTRTRRSETPIEGGAGSLAPEKRLLLSLKFASPVPLAEIDSLTIRARAEKKLTDASRAIVERTRKQVELDWMRSRERE